MNQDQATHSGPPDDLALIHRLLAGDARSFEPLVRRYERPVFRVTLAALRDAEDAEDAMPDAFIKAFRRLRQFRREGRFTPWLARIAAGADMGTALAVRLMRGAGKEEEHKDDGMQRCISQPFELRGRRSFGRIADGVGRTRREMPPVSRSFRYH